MKGYKVFDKNMKCRGFQFESGKDYKHSGEIQICASGFHFCEKLSDCFSYYDFNPQNIVCEVEAIGKTETHSEDSKVVTGHIKIGRILSWEEVLKAANEGANNTDTGTPETGTPDTGTPETVTPDTGTPETGTPARFVQMSLPLQCSINLLFGRLKNF